MKHSIRNLFNLFSCVLFQFYTHVENCRLARQENLFSYILCILLILVIQDSVFQEDVIFDDFKFLRRTGFQNLCDENRLFVDQGPQTSDCNFWDALIQ